MESDNKQLLTEVEVASGRYLPSREPAREGGKYLPLATDKEVNSCFSKNSKNSKIIYTTKKIDFNSNIPATIAIFSLAQRTETTSRPKSHMIHTSGDQRSEKFTTVKVRAAQAR